MPSKLSRWINRNLADRTLETLDRLGVDVPRLRQRNVAASIPFHVEGTTLEKRLRTRLDEVTIRKSLTVGTARTLPSTFYIDVMGATTAQRAAEALAADLCAHWRNLLENEASSVHADIDFIVTPKAGSPILGYEFAKLLRKPFVAFNETAKFISDKPDFKAEFDCMIIPSEGARALLVDDSSTGGSKAVKAVERLKEFGYRVSDFVVLFEPMLKSADGANSARRLAPHGVTLWSVFKI
jgi:orotate phosphoribosyltransferase